MLSRINIVKIMLIMGCLLLITGCSHNDKKENKTIQYERGLPEADSPAMITMLSHYMSGYHPQLFSDDERDIYQHKGITLENKKLTYFQYEKNDLIEQFNLLREDEDPAQAISSLWDNEDYMKQVDDESKWYLPQLTLENDDLHITTNDANKQFKMNEIAAERNIELSNELLIDLLAVNEESFYLLITDAENNHETYHFFHSQDLTEHVFFEDQAAAWEDFISDETFQHFAELFSSIDQEGKLLQSYSYQKVIDTGAASMVTIKEDDLLSRDGKYVLLNGQDRVLPEDEEITIQKTSDYLTERDEIYTSFKVDYKKLAKELGFKSSGSASIGKVVYFTEDILVLFVNFNAPIAGKAGQSNVIIDFQEDKENPTYYLVDLDINSFD